MIYVMAANYLTGGWPDLTSLFLHVGRGSDILVVWSRDVHPTTS